MTYVIALPYVDIEGRTCMKECPIGYICRGNRMLYIHPEECVNCGACEPVYPVEAIYYKDDLLEDQKGYLDIDARFFEDPGPSGGTARLGPANRDHPAVGQLPPQGE